tara:strand:- start:1219 stop:2592 length:1374 start_codon:yes stop_codon:yes gene_type:complete
VAVQESTRQESDTGAINEPYSGYLLRDVPSADAEITHTDPGTPMGELMRRYWQPVCLSEELKDLPKAVRVLNEDLVAFRDNSGEVGILHRHCSHRGTSLEYGIVSEGGLRCCYHGWLFAPDGTILETPGEPPDSRLKDSFRHGAYPAREHMGLVFAYMGAPGEEPEFPIFDTYEEPDDRMVPYSVWHDCNWLQVQENIMDPIHACFLHMTMSGQQLSESFAGMPELEFYETEGGSGMLFVTSRRVDERIWVRTNHALLPNFLQIGPIFPRTNMSTYFARVGNTRWCVPIDNNQCVLMGWRHFSDLVDPEGQGREELCGPNSIDLFGQDGNRTYEERQREPGDWEALIGQRSIAVHALEHLGVHDAGVTMLRRLLREAVRSEIPDAVASAQRGTGGPHINTFTQDAVLKIPPSGGDDRTLLQEVGRKVFDTVMESVSYFGDERRAFVRERYQEMERSA